MGSSLPQWILNVGVIYSDLYLLGEQQNLMEGKVEM